MQVSRRTQVARWGGALLVALAPLPWLGLGTAVAAGSPNAPGNNGTLKVHEQGTPSGSESNDPKVCIFNFEGFSFDEGQTGNIMIDGQGQSSGSFGPVSFGPADANGFYATAYVNDGGLEVPDGHYKATLYGKDLPDGQQITDKAKSKVFKVECGVEPEPSPSESTKTPKPSESETTKTPHPSETTTTPDVSPSETTTTPDVSPSETTTTPDVSPSETTTEPSTSPSTVTSGTSQPENTHTQKTTEPTAKVKPTRLTQAAALPQTGSDVPVGTALLASLLLIGLGALLLLGPGRLASATRYNRKH